MSSLRCSSPSQMQTTSRIARLKCYSTTKETSIEGKEGTDAQERHIVRITRSQGGGAGAVTPLDCNKWATRGLPLHNSSSRHSHHTLYMTFIYNKLLQVERCRTRCSLWYKHRSRLAGTASRRIGSQNARSYVEIFRQYHI